MIAGPWRIAGFAGEHDEAGAVVVDVLNRRVCTTAGGDADYHRYHENANLIAAAPELLAACKTLLPYAEEHNDCGPLGAGWQSTKLIALIGEAVTAIAKAEGN